MDRQDWNKFVKVFNLDVNVTVRKEISKCDVILALLDEGQIAFRGKGGHQFVMKVNKDFDFDLLKKIVWNPIREYVQESKSTDKQEANHNGNL